MLARTDVLVQTFADNLMTYALGRRLSAADMPAVRALVRQAASQENRLSAFVVGVVKTSAFREKGADDPSTTAVGDARVR